MFWEMVIGANTLKFCNYESRKCGRERRE